MQAGGKFAKLFKRNKADSRVLHIKAGRLAFFSCLDSFGQARQTVSVCFTSNANKLPPVCPLGRPTTAGSQHLRVLTISRAAFKFTCRTLTCWIGITCCQRSRLQNKPIAQGRSRSTRKRALGRPTAASSGPAGFPVVIPSR